MTPALRAASGRKPRPPCTARPARTSRPRRRETEARRQASRPRPLRESSPLFRLALAHALQACDVVYILSAQHELVPLDQVLAAYDCSLARLSARERIRWGAHVSATLRQLLADLDVERPVYCGAAYLAPLQLPAPLKRCTPLARLGIGQRLAWLRQHATVNVDHEKLDDSSGVLVHIQVLDRPSLKRLCQL